MGLIDIFIDKITDSLIKKGSVTRSLNDPMLVKMINLSDKNDEGVTMPYSQSMAVYACINSKARNIAQVPYKIYKLKNKSKNNTTTINQKIAHLKSIENEEVQSGNIIELFNNPNPTISRFQLWESLIVNIDLYGSWFLIPDQETTKDGVPLYLHTYASNYFTPAYSNDVFVGWKLKINNQEFFYKTDEVITDKYYNPYDAIKGLSPIDCFRLSMETDVNARIYNRNFFKNDATPSVVYSTDISLDDNTYNRLKTSIIDARRGVSKAHNSLLLDGGLKANQIGLSQKDIEFISQINLSLSEACMIFGVPKSEVSRFEDMKYSNAFSADRGYWTKTLLPLMTRIEDKLNQSLLNKIGYEGYFDVKSIDAVNFAFLEKVDSATKLYQLGFTANEINERLDLGFEYQEWRDEPIQQGFNIPINEPVKTFQKNDNISNDELIEKTRQQIWRETDAKIIKNYGKLKKNIRNYFFEVRTKILKKIIKGYKSENMKLKDAYNTKDFYDDIRNAVNSSFDDNKLMFIVEEICKEVINDGAKSFKFNVNIGQLDDTFLARVSKRANNVKIVNETAKDLIINKIDTIIREGIEQGLTEVERTKNLIDGVKDELDNIEKRARTIARTETHGAFAEGRHLAMASTKPKYKMWIAAPVGARDSHANLNGTKVKFEDEFPNGLMHPLDPNGSADEVINCRCIEYPIYSEDDNL